MAGTRESSKPTITTFAGTPLVRVVDGTLSRNMSLANLLTAMGGGGGASELDDLTDVTITAAADGDVLRHNGTSWVDTPGTDHYLPVTQPHNTQTGTTYTLVLSDANKMVTLDNAGAITLTVPPNASVAFPVGTQIDLAQLGAGAVTVAQGSGVTVNKHADDTLVFDGQYAVATLVKYATDTWLLFGKLVAA